MGSLKKFRKWLGIFIKFFGKVIPLKLKTVLQAIQLGLGMFLKVYIAVREAQYNKIKRSVSDTAEKIKDPRLSLEERLELNEKMESHLKYFVSNSGDK